MESFTDDIPNVTEGSKEEVKDDVDSDDTGRSQFESARLFWSKITSFKDKPKTPKKVATNWTRPGNSSTETTDTNNQSQDTPKRHSGIGKISAHLNIKKESSNKSKLSRNSAFRKARKTRFKRVQRTEDKMVKGSSTTDDASDKDSKVPDVTQMRWLWSKIRKVLGTNKKKTDKTGNTSNVRSGQPPDVELKTDSSIADTKSTVDEPTVKGNSIAKLAAADIESNNVTQTGNNPSSNELNEVQPMPGSGIANTESTTNEPTDNINQVPEESTVNWVWSKITYFIYPKKDIPKETEGTNKDSEEPQITPNGDKEDTSKENQGRNGTRKNPRQKKPLTDYKDIKIEALKLTPEDKRYMADMERRYKQMSNGDTVGHL
ncbi:hypothetical protein LSH36_168g02011 [Paralvinella palmiformis]|uniref:Uncharacterized protein n=1 Tax=Paralvinella palmiformis TaxID=53620 RepID=A0AAD9JTT2_9ANNE|nr:hypothetical protein LSH36_168g02011 [Paralvinella palmiformis]